jgi:hypothetical protein
MPACPYCSDVLLRHIHGESLYWFCRSCWQTIPDLKAAGQPVQVPFLATRPPLARLIILN